MFNRKTHNPKPTRILKRETISPIHVEPGDHLQLTYVDPDGRKRVVCEEQIRTSMTVTELAVTEHDAVPELGMGKALAGWFGEKA